MVARLFFSFILLFCVMANSSLAKTNDQQGQFWFATFLNRPIQGQWNFFQEIQWRWATENSHLAQFVFRPAVIYRLSDVDQFTFGSGTVLSRPIEKGRSTILNMLWQQYMRLNITKYWTQARFRLEQRYLEEGGNPGHRFRFLWRLDFPFWESATLVTSSETFLNLTRTSWNGGHGFDQHRLLLGRQTKGEGINWAINYIWQYIPRANIDTNVHVLQYMLLF
jgi:hypothetical protein